MCGKRHRDQCLVSIEFTHPTLVPGSFAAWDVSREPFARRAHARAPEPVFLCLSCAWCSGRPASRLVVHLVHLEARRARRGPAASHGSLCLVGLALRPRYRPRPRRARQLLLRPGGVLVGQAAIGEQLLRLLRAPAVAVSRVPIENRRT